MSQAIDEDLQQLNKNVPGVYRLGSVKKIRGVEGVGPWLFDFSDHYSLFDWGKMPDELPSKGKSLALMSLALYDHLSNRQTWKDLKSLPDQLESNPVINSCLDWLKAQGLQTHLKGAWGNLGPMDRNSDHLWNTKDPLYLNFTPFKVQKPSWNENKSTWDYSSYKNPKLTGMVPLEVVFRFGLPEGSSFRKRMKDRPYIESLFDGLSGHFFAN